MTTNLYLDLGSIVKWMIKVIKIRIAPGQYQKENVESLNILVKKVV